MTTMATPKYTVQVEAHPEVYASVDECSNALPLARAIAKALAAELPGRQVTITEPRTGHAVDHYIGEVASTVRVWNRHK